MGDKTCPCIHSHHINWPFLSMFTVGLPPFLETSENTQKLIFVVDYHSNKRKFGSTLTIAWDDPTDSCFHPADNVLKELAFVSRLEQSLYGFCRHVKYLVRYIQILHRTFICALYEIKHDLCEQQGAKYA